MISTRFLRDLSKPSLRHHTSAAPAARNPAHADFFPAVIELPVSDASVCAVAAVKPTAGF
jgi:hypothetical protein